MNNRKKFLPTLPAKGGKIVTVILLLFYSLGMHAQSKNDFGIDLTLGGEKTITKWLSFGLDANFRTQNDSKSVERYDIGGAFDFKLYSSKHLDIKASAGWEYMWQKKLDADTEIEYDSYDQYLPGQGLVSTTYIDKYKETSDFWRNRHRTTISVAFDFKPNKRWDITLRESMQYNHYFAATQPRLKYKYDDDDDDAEYYSTVEDLQSAQMIKENDKDIDSKNLVAFRTKLTVQYNIKHSIFSPYVSGDFGCYTTNSDCKLKLAAGTDISLSKHNKLDVFYRYQTEDDEDEPHGHILGLAYKYKF